VASSLTLAIKIALVTICEFVLCHIGQSLLRCEFGRLEVLQIVPPIVRSKEIAVVSVAGKAGHRRSGA
jgi:hypothetical protein